MARSENELRLFCKVWEPEKLREEYVLEFDCADTFCSGTVARELEWVIQNPDQRGVRALTRMLDFLDEASLVHFMTEFLKVYRVGENLINAYFRHQSLR